ncbi:methylmalonyl-CoA decarboxylase [Variibacter gotjawalensis]|uniref:Methylmalonyl-CoA decarboxylase n=1 Tax=Variibacter gotjawalensis TaxID=1333996 RepID=A0A0S3PR86_9BRAD|nr:enoyl-CoA hydratase [Variibacter gotjawalensis]NIK48725.1 enoyl-CoA hydratase/carnithine racemase [Variibacter gotjawalensis]RZS50586.1 enoyl-CoA hydratase/carnithine racemase [Variibacter gotjawalensis]BAT58420.1 methylmalonyl-CoA decarboxylase [Variibacter gotjawalensis]
MHGTSEADKVLSRVENGVGWITFNNPERRNAMSLDMWARTADYLEAYAKDDKVRVVVLTGAGDKAFVSGADISKFGTERSTPEAIAQYAETTKRVNDQLYAYPKPTIAMIRGYCVGGGLGLALACDLRFCVTGSQFSVPAAKLGLGYAYPGIKRLVDTVGIAFAKEIFFTAKLFTSQQAYEMGLVNRVVPEAELAAFVDDYAQTIAGNAPLTVNSTKFIIDQSAALDPDLEKCDAMVAACFASSDYREGRSAFMEKRKPKFTGS